MRHTGTEKDIKDNTSVKGKKAKEGKELKRKERTLFGIRQLTLPSQAEADVRRRTLTAGG